MGTKISNLTIKERLVSNDGTTKFLLRLEDGNCIETVLLIQDYGNTVCVSSQVGCKMGCKFCASGSGGFVRNLTSGEMLAQVNLARTESPKGTRLTHVVLMGMGEPFDNFDNVIQFLDKVEIGARKISVSTCGLPDKIRAFADKAMQVNLCISLHAPNDVVRRKIMPIAERYTVDEIFSAVKYFFDKTKRRVIFEYSLIDGINCMPEHARELAKRLHSAKISYHVNLINLNNFNKDFKPPSRLIAMKFMDTLIKSGISCTMRKGKGQDIMAACGQLKMKQYDAEVSISLDPSMDVNLKEYLDEINQLKGISIHLDIMRKSMVGQDRCTLEQYKHVMQNSRHPVDVHFMCVEEMPVFGTPKSVTMHPVSAVDIDAPIPNLSSCKVVTVMCVKAGKSGQKFNIKSLEKIGKIRKKYPDIRIIADGGINDENIESVRNAGANTIVVGSFIYNMPNAKQREQAVAMLQDILRK